MLSFNKQKASRATRQNYADGLFNIMSYIATLGTH